MKWTYKVTLEAPHGQADLLHMADCFGIRNRDTLFSIAMKSTDEKTKNTLETCYNNIEENIERDLTVLKEHGLDYYVTEHAKPYINAAYDKEKTAKALQYLQHLLNFQEYNEVKAVLRDMFTAICFNFLFVDKKQFVIVALKNEGLEPVKYSKVLAEEFVKEIRRELAQEKQIPLPRRNMYAQVLRYLDEYDQNYKERRDCAISKTVKNYLCTLDPQLAQQLGIEFLETKNQTEDEKRMRKSYLPKLKKKFPDFPDLLDC